MTAPKMTVDILQAFADAWNRHDIESLMSFMTDDCVFEAGMGTEVAGTTYEGREAVRLGFMRAWQTVPDARWMNAHHFLSGERGVSEWTFSGTNSDGQPIEVKGCDIFHFRGDKIVRKNSFRKQRT
jgi:ketosteroid isomerase-like protein